jgi:transposase
MHYELADYEWTAIRPMLPNKPRGVPRVADQPILNGSASIRVWLRLAEPAS